MSIDVNKSLIHRLFDEIWNEGKVEAVEEFYASDVISHVRGREHGAEAIREWVRELHVGLPDFRLTVDRLIAEGDEIASHLTFTGTHRGEWLGVPPTGKQVSGTLISIVRFSNGKIVEYWVEMNTLETFQQLGMLPACP